MEALKLISIGIALCCSFSCCFSIQKEIDVSPDCTNSSLPNCTELDSALKSLNSNTTLYLEAGDHVLREYHGWHNLGMHDISVIGNATEPVRITCSDESETGLAFINVTNLVISNVVVDGCGLTNASLRNATSIVKEFLYLNFVIPDSIRVGIFLAHCTNLKISSSMITNTKGLGMLGINIIGNSNLSNVNFTYNIRPHCNPNPFPDHVNQDLFDQIGGGAYFLYQDLKDFMDNTTLDSTLEISHCNFRSNAECSYASHINMKNQYSPNATYMYVFGGGGGLSLFMPQTMFSVRAVTSHSIFSKNDARYGAGAHIGLFAGFSISVVVFQSCIFESNGISAEEEGPINKSWANGGAGVAIFTDLLQHALSTDCVKCKKNITFIDTNFTHNSALVQGGGVFVYSISRKIHTEYNPEDFNARINFTRCNFQHNSAKYGLAMYASQRATHAIDGAWALFLNDVKVEASYTSDGNILGFSRAKISAVYLRSMVVAIGGGNFTIQNNTASGLHLMSSAIFMFPRTSLVVQGNRARRGGGMYMDGNTPVIIAEKECTIVFHANTASAEGGGVYYESRSDQQNILEPFSLSGCFLSSSAAIYGSNGSEMFNSNITIHFEDNVAPTGSMVFGSSLNSCSWARLLNSSDEDLYMELYNNYGSTFQFSQAPQGKEVISTKPHLISVTKQSRGISSYAGQARDIGVSVKDVFANEINAVLTSDTSDEHQYNTTVGPNGFFYYITNETVQLFVRGQSEDNITVSLYTASNSVSTNITVNIMKCPIGFDYNNITQKCTCNDLIKAHDILCDENLVQIMVPPGKWLGCESDKCSSIDDLIFLECHFDYCDPSESVFDPSNSSIQCAKGSNRAGIMCGECIEGYSISLGAEHCAKCAGHFSLGIVLTIYALGGLILFLAISLSRITIDKGCTNMLILFSNIAFPYDSYELDTATPIFRYLLIPTLWINLEVGFTHCIHDGPTPIYKVVVRAAFLLYLYILMGLFAILCRCSSFVSKHFSPAKTLFTLTILTYVKIIKTCVEILAVKRVKNLAGTEVSTRWLVDPNVMYFHGLHGFLGGVSILVLLVYVIPFPLLLVSPTLAYKYGQRFKPFLDAIWDPFKPKCRMWVSLRLVLRVVVIMCTMLTVSPHHVGIMINLSLITIFLYTQCLIQPFKSKWINIADNFLVLCVLYMHYAEYYWYVQLVEQSNLSPGGSAYVYVCLILSYLVLLSTFLWYSKATIMQFLSAIYSQCCKCRRKSYTVCDVPAQPTIQNRPTHSSVNIVPSARSTPESHLWPPRHKSYSRYRESLFENDDSMQFVAN